MKKRIRQFTDFFKALRALIALGIDIHAILEAQGKIAHDQRSASAAIIQLVSNLQIQLVHFEGKQEQWNMDVKTALANLQQQVTDLITTETANQTAVSDELTAVEAALTSLAGSTTADPAAIQALADQLASANTDLKASTQKLTDETAKINAAIKPPVPTP